MHTGSTIDIAVCISELPFSKGRTEATFSHLFEHVVL